MKLAAATVLAILLGATPVFADKGAQWLRDRISGEWIIGAGGWRSGLGLDERAPGFETLMGGTELLVALDFVSGFGMFADGRFVAGGLGKNLYMEGLGALGFQFRVVKLLRIRAGAAAGQAFLRGDSAVLCGGVLAASIDLFPLGSGRLSTALTVRFDIDGHFRAKTSLPDQSMALAIGLGIRY